MNASTTEEVSSGADQGSMEILQPSLVHEEAQKGEDATGSQDSNKAPTLIPGLPVIDAIQPENPQSSPMEIDSTTAEVNSDVHEGVTETFVDAEQAPSDQGMTAIELLARATSTAEHKAILQDESSASDAAKPLVDSSLTSVVAEAANQISDTNGVQAELGSRPQSAFVSQDDMMIDTAHPSSNLEVGSEDIALDSKLPTVPHETLKLSKYQPGEIPVFRGRSKSVQLPCGTHYTFTANWPPPKPTTCELGQRIDVFPPADAPLHVWIQAYALRWGVWAAEIKDDKVREQVLNAVTDKMKLAWETAITEGYYLRPNGDTADQQQGDSDDQTRRKKKRAVSPSKEPAGLIPDGKNKLFITNGELSRHGITMDMINTRVESRDFRAGELRLDDILSNLDRDELVVKDWSVSSYPSAFNRNLLMYCFWAVQEERKSVYRLKNLMRSFTRDVQKKNTQARIDTAQEREFQHLALATELALQERNQSISDAKTDNMDTTPVDLTSEADGGESQSSENDDSEAPAAGRQVVLDLAQEVLTASSEKLCFEAFTKRELHDNDFAEDGLDIGRSKNFESAKSSLGQIYQYATQLTRLRQIVTGPHRDQDPREILRLGHDARLVKEKLENERQKLQRALANDLEITSVPPLESFEATPPSVKRGQPTEVTTAQRYDQGRASASPTKQEATDTIGGQSKASEYESTASNSLQPQTALRQAPSMNTSTLTPMASVQQAVPDMAQLKIAYINEHWADSLNNASINAGLPPNTRPITSWNDIKELLTQAGFGVEVRNEQVRRFKAGFHDYCRSKGVQMSDRPPASPSLSAATAASPALSHASVQNGAPPNWPSDAEILAAVPPQGIPAAQLIGHFGARVGQYRQQFMHAVQRLCVYDPTRYMVLGPKQNTPQFDLASPTAANHNMDSTQQQSASAPHRVIKFKLPHHHAPVESQLPAQDEHDFPEGFRSNEVNDSKGFSFRHLPHASLEQRQRMDHEMDEYISGFKGRKKKPFGQYVTFVDPQDPASPPVVHGIWQLQNKEQPPGTEWFYAGEDMPPGWDPSADATEAHQKEASEALTQEHTPLPRIKLNLRPPTQNVTQGDTHVRRNAQVEAKFSPTAYQSTGRNTYPPGYGMFDPNGTWGGPGYTQGYGAAHGGTVNPADLMRTPPGQYTYNAGMPYNFQGKGQEEGTSNRRGTKRARSGIQGGGRKQKKRKTAVDEDEDDDDYDPSQEY